MVGLTIYHLVADGHATSNFLVAWGLASRGLAIDPLPLHDRASFFVPRSPPRLEFKHRGVEFMTKNKFDKVKSERAHEVKPVRISVNGRTRLSPRVPNEYFGNLVLWAFPRAKVAELIGRPLQFAAELIHDEVAKVNDGYFRSFIDFASSGVVESENLVPTADIGKSVPPNMEVNSWLRFPFYDLDFGGESPPYYFMPSYLPLEGLLFILQSPIGDGSIDAFVPLFRHNVDARFQK